MLIEHVREYPAMAYFELPRHTQSMIASRRIRVWLIISEHFLILSHTYLGVSNITERTEGKTALLREIITEIGSYR
mgnify:CR=1 FL=1